MEGPIHPREVSLEDGAFLVRLARRAIREKLVNDVEIEPPPDTPKHLFRPGMTFTTIEKILANGRTTLRGCIGFLHPIYSLVESAIKSAIEAATNDPRFPPMSPRELDRVVLEVSILSIPEEVVVDSKWDIPSKILVGRDGLVVEMGFYKGTLLPVVPVEYCWDVETFLAETCIKAGLKPSCWLDERSKIYRYEGRAFKEVEPSGTVLERDLVEEYRDRCSKRGEA